MFFPCSLKTSPCTWALFGVWLATVADGCGLQDECYKTKTCWIPRDGGEAAGTTGTGGGGTPGPQGGGAQVFAQVEQVAANPKKDFQAALQSAVFVSPNGSAGAEGSKEAPVDSLEEAIQLATDKKFKKINLEEGTYPPFTLEDGDGIVVTGGYDKGFTGYGKGESIFAGKKNGEPALRGKGSGTVAFHHVTFVGGKAEGEGGSSVAVVVEKGNVLFQEATLRAQDGTPGKAGNAGKTASGTAKPGNPASSTAGGGAQLCEYTLPDGSTVSSTGGKGGDGSSDANTASKPGEQGQPGADNKGEGAANDVSRATAGKEGAKGEAGTAGAETKTWGQWQKGAWLPAVGSSGNPGQPGQGGGGGGGAYNRGGGGGGCGGAPGLGGQGGGGGGGSFALVVGPTATVQLKATTLQTGNGGPGGEGGTGGQGKDGEEGGKGHDRQPGNGGPGGKGGDGGPGRGGPGGPSVGVLNLTGTKLDLTGTKVQLGKPGAGGGGPAPGAAGVQQDEWNPSLSK